MAKAKRLKQTEGGSALPEYETSRKTYGRSNKVKRDINLPFPKLNKKKKKKKPVKGILEGQGY